MAQAGTPGTSFEDLWQSALDNPIKPLDVGEDEGSAPTAESLVASLRRLVDACRADALVSDEDHAELQKCCDTFARVLGAIPPEDLRTKLTSLGDFEN